MELCVLKIYFLNLQKVGIELCSLPIAKVACDLEITRIIYVHLHKVMQATLHDYLCAIYNVIRGT